MNPLDALLFQRIKTILEKDDPTVAELELARKFLNDRSARGIDAELREEDPSATAEALYGKIEFDELPLTQARYLEKVQHGGSQESS